MRSLTRRLCWRIDRQHRLRLFEYRYFPHARGTQGRTSPAALRSRALTRPSQLTASQSTFRGDLGASPSLARLPSRRQPSRKRPASRREPSLLFAAPPKPAGTRPASASWSLRTCSSSAPRRLPRGGREASREASRSPSVPVRRREHAAVRPAHVTVGVPPAADHGRRQLGPARGPGAEPALREHWRPRRGRGRIEDPPASPRLPRRRAVGAHGHLEQALLSELSKWSCSPVLTTLCAPARPSARHRRHHRRPHCSGPAAPGAHGRAQQHRRDRRQPAPRGAGCRFLFPGTRWTPHTPTTGDG